MSIVTELLSGIAEFAADVFLFRRQREQRGSTARSVAEDAAVVARFDFFNVFWIALVSVGVAAVLIFGIGLPVTWGLGIDIGLAVVGACWRYAQLVRE